MSINPEIAPLARKILTELEAAREVGEDVRREKRGIRLRLRSLLTLTDSATGLTRQARLMVLQAIKRTEIGDQLRRGSACHVGSEVAVEFPEDTDLQMLAEGLRKLADLAEN